MATFLGTAVALGLLAFASWFLNESVNTGSKANSDVRANTEGGPSLPIKVENVTVTQTQLRSDTDTYALSDIQSVHVVQEHVAWKWIRGLATFAAVNALLSYTDVSGWGWGFAIISVVVIYVAVLSGSVGVTINTTAGRKRIVHYRYLENLAAPTVGERMRARARAVADAVSDAISNANSEKSVNRTSGVM